MLAGNQKSRGDVGVGVVIIDEEKVRKSGWDDGHSDQPGSEDRKWSIQETEVLDTARRIRETIGGEIQVLQNNIMGELNAVNARIPSGIPDYRAGAEAAIAGKKHAELRSLNGLKKAEY